MSHSQRSSPCGTTWLHRPSGCSSAGRAAGSGMSTRTAAWRRLLLLISLNTPLPSAGCLHRTLQSTGSSQTTNAVRKRWTETKGKALHGSPTWLQGPVNHSMRFSQGPLLQTWESAGRSLPHPSRGRLLIWFLRQRTPRVLTPIPHSAEHWETKAVTVIHHGWGKQISTLNCQLWGSTKR